jgi:putative hydrolase of the HAD superfamily
MQTHTGIGVVAFDIDGVLIDVRFPTILPSALGISASVTNDFFAGPFADCLLGKKDLRELLPPYLVQWGWERTLDEFLEFWFEVESQLHYPTLALADHLHARGLRCFLASTQEQYRARYLEELLGLGERFDGGFFSCRLGCQKPDHAFYSAVTSEIGCKPSEILLIDDKSANVIGAQAFGWSAVLFRIGDDLDSLMRSIEIGQHVA